MSQEVATTTEEKSPEILNKIRVWGIFGETLHNVEASLQLNASAILMKLQKLPTKIEEIADAEATLKEAKSEINDLIANRKQTTGKLDKVTARLMAPEKSVEDPFKQYYDAIVKVKKEEEVKGEAIRLKNEQIRQCREYLLSYKAEQEATFKSKIILRIDKMQKHALENIALAEINDFIDLMLPRMTEADFKISYPLCTYNLLNAEEFTKICAEILLGGSKEFVALFQNQLRERFADFEVQLHNKAASLASIEKQSQEKLVEVTEEKNNAKVAAQLETTVLHPEVTTGVKALKKGYAVDMEDNQENMLKIMGAFAANKDKCMKFLRVNKWFSFMPAQAANALGKVKSEDNNFAPQGIIFKETEKL